MQTAFMEYMQDIRPAAKLLPLLLLGLIVFLLVKYKRDMAPRMGTLEWIQNYDRPRLSLDGVGFSMSKRDWGTMLVITAIYGIVAFYMLGSASAPQSFYTFEGENDRVTVDLGSDTEISGIMYYSGLYPGDYELFFSKDGGNWTRLVDASAVADENGVLNDAALHQSYADLFKWQNVNVGNQKIVARYIQIIARNLPMELGELALYGSDGALLDVSGVDSVLLDEQSTIPEAPSWFNSMYFDEIYHGRTAYEHIRNISPYEITHPPLGKELIALGISVFGMTPFGYRFMGTFFGVLMLLPLYMLLKNLFGKTKVAACGTILFAFEFMHFTQTRIATIDTYGVFFILLSFLHMWRWISAPYSQSLRHTWGSLALSGVSFGIGCACKWTVVYGGVGLALFWLLRLILKYRAVGLRGRGKEILGILGVSVGFFVMVPMVIYCLSYIPYGLAAGETFPGMLFRGEYYQIVWENQTYMFTYHAGVDQAHPYSSRWYQWLFDLKPILYYLRYNGDTKMALGAFNSPLVAWGGLASLIALLGAYYQRRRPQVILIWVGYLCQFLPWILIGRTTFAYHYFGASLFLVLAMAYVFDEMISRNPRNDRLVYAVTSVELLLFAMFYPVLTGMETSIEYCLNFLKWFPAWPWG